MEDFPQKQEKKSLDPETLELIERLKKMKPEIPKIEEDRSIKLRPPETSVKQKPKGHWQSFAERSLPNGDRD